MKCEILEPSFTVTLTMSDHETRVLVSALTYVKISIEVTAAMMNGRAIDDHYRLLKESAIHMDETVREYPKAWRELDRIVGEITELGVKSEGWAE